MATVTVGTDATTTLTGIVWPASIADCQTINLAILDDLKVNHPVAAISGVGGLSPVGKLFVPNRGSLLVYAGDVIAIDPASGFPILIGAAAIAAGDWNVA